MREMKENRQGVLAGAEPPSPPLVVTPPPAGRFSPQRPPAPSHSSREAAGRGGTGRGCWLPPSAELPGWLGLQPSKVNTLLRNLEVIQESPIKHS